MSNRTLAALAALLAFMAVLVAVPLATSEPAEAHPKTVQRCAYDPFAGRQCWTETSYNHPHTPVQRNICPAGTTGTPPNCLPVPSTNERRDPDPPPTTTTTASPPTTTTTEPPKCPAGTTGTPPNCVKDVCPSGYSGTPPNCVKEKVCPPGTTGTPPDCKKIEPPKCADGYSGTPPNCVKDKPKVCASGYSGTPPNCVKDTPQQCTANYHPYGSGCHPDHDWRLIPCGTGTWAPHAGHTPKQRPTCIGRGPHVEGEDIGTPCGASGSEGAVPHHQHSTPCHANTKGHTHDFRTKCPSSYQWSSTRSRCELIGSVKITQDVGRVIIDVEGEVLCALGASRVATTVVNTILKGVSEAAQVVARVTFEQTVENPCDQIWDELQEWAEGEFNKPDTADPKPDDDSGDGTDDDSTGTDGDDSEAEDEDPEPTPGICDRDTSPTNPYKIGPSNTTPQQWADWWAWFDCP